MFFSTNTPPNTLQETNISPSKSIFGDDIPFPMVGYVSYLEGRPIETLFFLKKKTGFVQVALAEQQIMLPIKGMNMWISIATSNVRGGRGGIELKTYATKNIRNDCEK